MDLRDRIEQRVVGLAAQDLVLTQVLGQVDVDECAKPWPHVLELDDLGQDPARLQREHGGRVRGVVAGHANLLVTEHHRCSLGAGVGLGVVEAEPSLEPLAQAPAVDLDREGREAARPRQGRALVGLTDCGVVDLTEHVPDAPEDRPEIQFPACES